MARNISRTSSIGSIGGGGGTFSDGGGGGGAGPMAYRSPMPYAGLSIGGRDALSGGAPGMPMPFGNLDATTGGVLTPRDASTSRGGSVTGGDASSSAGAAVLSEPSGPAPSGRSRREAPSIVAGMGWGLGLTNAGTYTSSRAPRKIALPLPDQDVHTFNVVKEVIVRRKRGRAAKRAAELVKGDLIDRAVQEAEDAATAAKKEAELAAARLKEKRAELSRVRSERDAKMKEIDAEFDGELQQRIRKVEREYEAKISDVMAEEIVIEEVRPEDLDEYKDLFQEKKGEEEEEEEEEEGEEGGDDKEEGEKMDVDEKKEEEEDEKKKSEDANDHGGEEDEEEDGEISEQPEVPKKKRRLNSEIKTEDFEKAKSDLNGLNDSKSQMVWLLKQVITAENKRKIEMKKREKEAAAAAKK